MFSPTSKLSFSLLGSKDLLLTNFEIDNAFLSFSPFSPPILTVHLDHNGAEGPAKREVIGSITVTCRSRFSLIFFLVVLTVIYF